MSMEVILVRHAIAYARDRTRWRDDGRRPLSPEGKRKFRKAAMGLAKGAGPVDRMLTSPLVRTRQTAELLTEVAGWPQALDADELAPGSSPTAILAMLRRQQARRIALVGHEPGLSALLAASIAGSAATLPLKKGGIASITFPAGAREGKGTLTAFVPPRVLRKMR